METTQTNHRPERPVVWFFRHYLAWLLPIIGNFCLIILFQALFVHTIPGPVVVQDNAGNVLEESLSAQPYFSGCTILDVLHSHDIDAFGDNDWWMDMGSAESLLVLYEDAGGAQRVARVDKNLVLDRWGIVEHATAPVEDGRARVDSYLGYYDITVRSNVIVGNVLANVRPVMFVRSIRLYTFLLLVVVSILLYGAERAALRLWRRRKKVTA